MASIFNENIEKLKCNICVILELNWYYYCYFMKVCIAEKPSVAREIAQVIGANKKHDGYFEGNGYQVTYTFGHFCTLYQPDDYKSHWKRWDLDNLPMLPERFETKLISNSGVKKQFGIIKKLLSKAELVINCGDAGQEGELIQRWVLKEANYKGEVQRLWISSLTKEAVKEGFKKLKPASDYDNLYYAGSSRAIGDWLLGMNATRLYTLKYGGYKQVLSIGRVQTPTLAILVKRYHEIQNFKPQKYWELQTHYREIAFNYEKGKFKNQEEGKKLLDKVKGKPFTILKVDKKKAKEYAPKLFDLTGLQVYCNKRFGYTADNTLKLVQKLYEQKLVTYPRVDTTYLPTDVYPKIKGVLAKLSNYSQFTASLLKKPIRKSKRVFDDKKITDHHAIIPTGMQKTLSSYEQNVYDAITRRFIAAFYPECIVSKTNVIGAVEDIQFKASGKEIIEAQWRVLYPKQKKSDDNGEKILPNFEVGESGSHKPSFLEKETKPPKNYTEASLLRAMETAGKQVDDEELRDLMKENGIGRPSTRANIIETLFKRKYITRKRKLLLPTPTGIELIEIIENKLLKSAELTGIWEKQLRDISLGKYKAQQFIRDMKKMVDDLVTEVRLSKSKFKSSYSQNSSKPKKTKAKSVRQKSIPGHICPKCKSGKLIKGKTAYGCSRWKEGCDFKLPFVFASKKISDNQYIRLLTKGSTVNLKGFKQGEKTIEALVRFDDNWNLVLEPKIKIISGNNVIKAQEKADKIPCPKCKKGNIIRGKTAYGCSRWKEGCDFRFDYATIKQKANGKKLTKELVIQILNSK